MDFGTREILILLGILVILAILLDGVRRVNNARHGKLRSGSRRNSRNPIFDDENDDYHSVELPAGRARVVQVRDEKSVVEISETIRRKADTAKGKLTSAFRSKVEQEQPPAAEHDPAIFDTPVRDRRREAPLFADEDDHYGHIANNPGDVDEHLDDSDMVEGPEHYPAENNGTEDDEIGDHLPNSPQSAPQSAPQVTRARDERVEPEISFRSASAQEINHSPELQERDGRSDGTPRRQSAGRPAPSQDDILVLHLMAHKGQNFEGEKLLELILDQGLRYSAMKIFHRHENKDGSGPVHFSLANSINPGTFDLNLIEQFASPGVTFIMPLDGLVRPLESFEVLIGTATAMAKKLDGELKDETRSALTKQTIEHYRQRIIDYTRRSFTLTN